MKKRISYFAAALVCAVLMFYGVNAFADANTSTGSSKTVSGTLASVAADSTSLSVTTEQGVQNVPLAKSVWVFRNEHKASLSDLQQGDRVDVVLNSKKQAAYIKSNAAVASPTPSPSALPTPTPTPTSTPTAKPAQPSPKATAYPGLEGLNVLINGPHFKLELKQNEGNGGVYELNLKPEEGGVVHLKGDEAAAWIQQLLSGIDLKSPDAKQKLLAEIGQHYGIDTSKLNVKVDERWQADAKNDDKADDQGKLKADDQGKHPAQHESKADEHEHEDHGQDHGKSEKHK